MTTRSNAYIGTLDPTSTEDMAKLAKLRARITAANKTGGFQQRVCVKGRKPKVKVGGFGYGFGGNIVGGLANAQALDVYIYAR